MEQLVARRAHNPKVVGSSPAPATPKAFQKNLRGFFAFEELVVGNYGQWIDVFNLLIIMC